MLGIGGGAMPKHSQRAELARAGGRNAGRRRAHSISATRRRDESVALAANKADKDAEAVLDACDAGRRRGAEVVTAGVQTSLPLRDLPIGVITIGAAGSRDETWAGGARKPSLIIP